MEKTGELTSESPSIKPANGCKCGGECKCRDTSEKLVKQANLELADKIIAEHVRADDAAMAKRIALCSLIEKSTEKCIQDAAIQEHNARIISEFIGKSVEKRAKFCCGGKCKPNPNLNQ